MGIDCDSGQQHSLLSVDQALNLLLSSVKPIRDTEILPLLACQARILAHDQHSKIDVPGFDNSAMDGYALRADDADKALPISQRICAGQVGTELQTGTAARIFTGAAIPPGADTVVMQERCHAHNECVRINGEVHAGDNIRRSGEDISKNAVILSQGDKLTAQALGLAASVGISELSVFRRLKVAVFFTGDELLEPEHAPQPGKIYNSNRYTLVSLLNSLGCEVIDLGVIADTLAATEDALHRSAAQSDLIITSGGVSVGEEDHVRHALENLGRLEVWKISIKPGKPLAFGEVDGTPFLGLPGNPVSVFVTFCVFARAFILRMQGGTTTTPPVFQVAAGFERKADKRENYYRVRLHADAGQPRAVLYPNQGSGVLTSTHWADGLLKVPAGKQIREGEYFEFYPYYGLLS
jgi:molybdopterin molybdotransferase